MSSTMYLLKKNAMIIAIILYCKHVVSKLNLQSKKFSSKQTPPPRCAHQMMTILKIKLKQEKTS